MSSEYMRKIMESIEAANQVNEGYEDRVQAVVDIITKNNPEGLSRKAFAREFERAGQQAKAVEMRGSPQARRDFEKDVAARLTFKRDTSTADAKRERNSQVLDRLMLLIDDAIGNAFPDGDPWDQLYPKMRKMGIRDYDMLDWLDRAVRKAKAGKSYHDYLRAVWNDYMSGNMGHGDQFKDMTNPW